MKSEKFLDMQAYFEAKEALERAEEKVFNIEYGDEQHLIGTKEHKRRRGQLTEAVTRFKAVCAGIKL